MQLSENIKQLRKAKNLRQEQFAKAMGVSTASVSKWETGQCAPELTVLIELADFFDVSVDTLVGHSVNAERMNTLIADMKNALEQRSEENALNLCQKLLRNYPNVAEAAEACVECYYRMFIFFDNPEYMKQCIAQTKRLMVLKQGEPEHERLERIRYLGNQYAMLKQWDKAQECYEQSNVYSCNQSSIAECLINQKCYFEALDKLSDDLVNRLFYVFRSVSNLADVWETLGEQDKACSALKWVYRLLDSFDYNPGIMMLIQLRLASIYQQHNQEELALDAVRKAAELISSNDAERPMADFIKLEKAPEFLVSFADSKVLLAEVTQKMGQNYADAVREILR